MIIEIIGPITETAVGPETETVTEMAIGMTIDWIIEGMIAIKDMAIGTKITVDLGKEMEEIEAVPGRVPNPGAVPKNRYEDRRQSRDNNRNRDRSEFRSRSSSHVSTNRDRSRCYRCNEYDHFARECPNDTSGRNSNNTEGSLLRMTGDEHLYALDYANGEDFNVALNM